MANFQQLSVEEAANAVKRGWVVAQMLEYITIVLEYITIIIILSVLPVACE